MEKVGGRN